MGKETSTGARLQGGVSPPVEIKRNSWVQVYTVTASIANFAVSFHSVPLLSHNAQLPVTFYPCGRKKNSASFRRITFFPPYCIYEVDKKLFFLLKKLLTIDLAKKFNMA